MRASIRRPLGAHHHPRSNQGLFAIGPVETLDVGMQVRPAWLNGVDAYAAGSAAVDENLRQQFGTVAPTLPVSSA
jgi:hypothetical protein